VGKWESEGLRGGIAPGPHRADEPVCQIFSQRVFGIKVTFQTDRQTHTDWANCSTRTTKVVSSQ